MKTRYKKVMRDLLSGYAKNAMLVIAMAMGVFGVGAILGGYSVVKREMTANYMGTVPASATLEMEDSLKQGLIDSVRQWPGVSQAERHATVLARMRIDDKWFPLLLFVVDDFEHQRTNIARHVSGEQTPPTGTLLVERTAFVVMHAQEGDSLLVKTRHGEAKALKIVGTVHDAGLAPAWQEQAGYGYITLSTLRALGEDGGFDQLRILVSEHADSRDHIETKAKEIAIALNARHHGVHEIQIPPPGKHPHQSQMSAVMTIFVMFSFLVLVLASILVGTAVATIMVKHVRQIGVMKTLGANSRQIAVMYLTMVFALCLVALVIAIPLSRVAAAAFYDQIAVLLNLEIRDASIPVWVVAVQVFSGIGIPLLSAAVPVLRGSFISVRKALDNHGVGHRPQQQLSWTMKMLSSWKFAGDMFPLAMRNVFRQRSRLAMTLGLLAAGGAMFMMALNVSEAWEANLSRIYQQRLYDVEFRLNRLHPTDTLLAKLKSIPGVTHVEGWNSAAVAFSKGNKGVEVTRTYPDKGHGSFSMQALPVSTQLLRPDITAGRWLREGQANEVVLNQLATPMLSSVALGDTVSLTVNQHTTAWTVVGFVEDVGTPATAYVSIEAFAKAEDTAGKSNVLRVAYADRSKESTVKNNRLVEALLEKENIGVDATIPVWLLRNAIAGHMKVLVNSLMAMALLMAVVGTLGLMSTMSMNVLERTREIGVMRTLGATPRKIRSLVVWEGVSIGVMSIFLAFALSLLLSAYIGSFIGHMAFRTPLSLQISIVGVVAWVAMVMAGAYVATLYPSKRANTITTREALAYE
ncbi:ABC transporter permease [Chryseolinea lacunae]|uniref:ABC transporter permease n=1 Tax=Chryseolinea lacunae TaxID=2801331 RepID=A0ABS1KMW6_9BACT|nr:ABC transporter permease [Chryseolinea lacunae]MBL0740800.1 ABC transporter permease [Chryseolinea lacunae]